MQCIYIQACGTRQVGTTKQNVNHTKEWYCMNICYYAIFRIYSLRIHNHKSLPYRVQPASVDTNLHHITTYVQVTMLFDDCTTKFCAITHSGRMYFALQAPCPTKDGALVTFSQISVSLGCLLHFQTLQRNRTRVYKI